MDTSEETVYSAVDTLANERETRVGYPVWFTDRVRQSLPAFQEGTDTAYVPIGFYFTPIKIWKA